MSKSRLVKFISALLASLFIVLLSPPAANAGVDDFEFESMHVHYGLSLGDHNIPMLTATETLVAVFPETDQNRGIQRLIPDDYRGHSLATEVTSVVDENGVARDFTTEAQDGYIQLISRHTDDRFVHGRQTYVITYSQKWVIGDFGTTDEFYWDVNGTGWAQPFGSVTASVDIASALSDLLRVDDISCYRGPQGSNQPCDSEQLLNRTTTTRVDFSAKDLAPGETLTINLPFTHGVVNTGNISQVTGSLEFVFYWVFGGIILAVLLWAIFFRVQVIGGRRMRKFATVQYEGPKTPELSVVAQVIGSRNWQSALLVQSAVLGYVTISTDDSDNWAVTRTGKEVQEVELKKLLSGLFENDLTVVALGRGIDEPESRRISNVFGELLRDAQKQALKQGFYSHLAIKQAFGGWLVIVGQTLGMIWAGLSMDAVVDAGLAALPILLGGVATIVHFLILLSKRLPTQAGMDLRVYMDGLKEYIQFAEKDRLAFLQSPKGATRERGQLGQTEILHLYEEVLPWAVLLGLADEWAKVLATYYDERHQPNWIPVATIGAFNLSGLDSAIAQSLA
ncbi:MAG: DUF2207 domain-containing protein, partial [Microbacteriaceae bacterium]|nr:DUF2207 domain-containing protein [Microbacteriaceae bacterium]